MVRWVQGKSCSPLIADNLAREGGVSPALDLPEPASPPHSERSGLKSQENCFLCQSLAPPSSWQCPKSHVSAPGSPNGKGATQNLQVLHERILLSLRGPLRHLPPNPPPPTDTQVTGSVWGVEGGS